MTAHKLPQLAEGSRWGDRFGEPCVIDDDDQAIAISQVVTMPGGMFIAIYGDNALTVGTVYVTDVLAIIRRAGLDTEYDALRLAAKELTQECRGSTCTKDGDQIIYLDDIKTQLEKLEVLL